MYVCMYLPYLDHQMIVHTEQDADRDSSGLSNIVGISVNEHSKQ